MNMEIGTKAAQFLFCMGIHKSKFLCSEQEKVDEEEELSQKAIELEEDVLHVDGGEEESVAK